MPSIFDTKIFNAEVFNKYADKVADLKKNALIKAGVLNDRTKELANNFKDQVGGNYQVIPIFGRIGGEPVNYDGGTDITASSRATYSQQMVVVGRAKGWVEKDFSYDITGGTDFMPLATEVEKYWQDYYQEVMLSTLKGVFSMSGGKNGEFVTAHTTDITGGANAEAQKIAATTVNTAIQKASGDNKSVFSVVIMHSTVATNLENLQILTYFKAVDAEGMQRDVALATLNGKVVFIDDNMPTEYIVTTDAVKGIYTITITTAGGVGDTITVGGVTYTYAAATSIAGKTIAVGDTSTTQATELKTLLAAQYAGVFTVTSSTNTVILTQVVGGTGAKPTLVATKVPSTGTIVAAIADTETGVAEVGYTAYTTYVLGAGAFHYGDFGAAVPSEMERNAATNGGQTTLYSRKRRMYAPHGISFEPAIKPTSPSLNDLETGSNWTLVHDSQVSRGYINHKEIPIARVISRG